MPSLSVNAERRTALILFTYVGLTDGNQRRQTTASWMHAVPTCSRDCSRSPPTIYFAVDIIIADFPLIS